MELEPTIEELQISEIGYSELITEYLKGKDSLRDFDNDSFNIANKRIHSWNFTNIPKPTLDELIALIPILEQSKNKELIFKRIVELEKSITPRKVREALLSNNYSFIQDIEDQIQVLRENL